MLKIFKKVLFLIIILLILSHFYGPNIRPIPKFWSFIPYLHKDMASSIYPNIYLTEVEYEEYKNSKMSIWTRSVLIHENEHIKNWKKIGYLKFPYLYLSNKSFRLEEELRAIKEQMIFLKHNGENYDIDRKAKQFSDQEYGNLMTYEEAYKTLEDLWNQTNQ